MVTGGDLTDVCMFCREIVKMDNRPVHGKMEASEASNIIMNTYGGPEGLASRLKTNTEVSDIFSNFLFSNEHSLPNVSQPKLPLSM